MISPAVHCLPGVHGVRLHGPIFHGSRLYGHSIMDRLKHRREFLRASSAPAWKTPSVIVQAHKRGDETPARSGFTVTKKLGNAVTRNKIRRRLKEAVRLVEPDRLATGTDYVFIGRQLARQRPFNLLMEDIDQALEHLNNGQSNHRFARRIAK